MTDMNTNLFRDSATGNWIVEELVARRWVVVLETDDEERALSVYTNITRKYAKR